MAYVNSNKILAAALKGRYAIGAFNIENMETLQAAVRAAETMNTHLIVQTTGGSVKYAGADYFAAMAKAAAKNAGINITLHMDHGSLENCIKAIETGYSSVMIDGSKLPLEDNVRLTKEVVALARKRRVSVEAELGKLGGKEDDVESACSCYTDPLEAEYFVKETKVDSLAIAIGTAHGIYKSKPVLNIGLITLIKQRVAVPLVLHGASGLSDQDVRTCIANGICKVNFATELRAAFTDGVKRYLSANPGCADPKEYLAPARNNVESLIKERMGIMR